MVRHRPGAVRQGVPRRKRKGAGSRGSASRGLDVVIYIRKRYRRIPYYSTPPPLRARCTKTNVLSPTSGAYARSTIHNPNDYARHYGTTGRHGETRERLRQPPLATIMYTHKAALQRQTLAASDCSTAARA